MRPPRARWADSLVGACAMLVILHPIRSVFPVAALVFAWAFGALLPTSASAVLLDAIVATVETEVILYSDVVGEVKEELDQIRRASRTQDEYDRKSDTLLRAALDQAIETKLLYREALLRGVEVADEEVESQVDSLRDLFETNEQFMKEVELAGETLADFRVRVRKRLLAQRMAYIRMRFYEDQEVVSEGDIATYYEENRDGYVMDERVHLRQIFLRAGRKEEARAEARARLETIRDEIVEGADFAEMAELHSEAPGADEGGVIGWQRRGDLIPVLEDAAFSLDIEELSEVLESRRGFHILMADERERSESVPLDEARESIEPILRTRAAEVRFRKWVSELRERGGVRVFL